MNRNFNVIFKYSITNKIKSKSFTMLSLVLFLLIVGGMLIFGYVTTNSEATKVGIVNENETNYEVFSANLDLVYEEIDYEKTTNIDDFEDDYDFVIDIDNYIVYTYGGLSFEDDVKIDLALSQLNVINVANDLEMNLDEVNLLLAPPEISYESVGDSKDLSDNAGALLITTAFTILGMFILIYGTQFLGQEILDEKTTRAMEVIMISVSAKQHMFAKIFSNLVFILTLVFEALLFLAIGFVLAEVVFPNSIEGITAMIGDIASSLDGSEFSLIIITFILLVITLLILYIMTAVISGTVTTVEEYQSSFTIITITTLLFYFISIFVTDIEIRTIISYLPIGNFYTLPGLIVVGSATTIQIVISIAVSLITLIIIAIFGVKVYRIGVLNYSAKGVIHVIKQALKK